MHMAKSLGAISGLPPALIPFGSHISNRFGSDSFSLAFTAYSGEFMEAKKVVPIPDAPSGTLENEIQAQTNGDSYFLDTDKLISLGQATARPLGYVFKDGKWDGAFDGMLWMQKERPYALPSEN